MFFIQPVDFAILLCKNKCMLNKKDLSCIEELIQKNLKNGLREFFETLILPYFDHNEKDHDEMKKILRKHDERFDSHDKRFDSHDKRFDSIDRELDSIQRKLEKNEDDHEEIFHRLDRIEVHVTSHEKRIKRVETALSS